MFTIDHVVRTVGESQESARLVIEQICKGTQRVKKPRRSRLDLVFEHGNFADLIWCSIDLTRLF